MKYWVFLIAFLGCSIIGRAQTTQPLAEEAEKEVGPAPLVPPMSVGGWKLSPEGFVRITASSEKVIGGKYAELTELRPMFRLETPHEPLTFFAEFQLANVTDEECDWLQQSYADYQLNEQWLVRSGRFFTAAAFFTSPEPMLLETVRYPREPWGCYGWGFQIEGSLGCGWNLMADVTGASDANFADDRNWDHLEFSAHVGKELVKGFSLGFETQLSEEFQRVATDFTWNASDRLTINGELYYANEHEDERDIYGGYALANYSVTKNMRAHLQFDYQQEDPGDGGLIVTPGILLRLDDDRAWFILDYEWNLGEPSDSGLFAAVQFRF